MLRLWLDFFMPGTKSGGIRGGLSWSEDCRAGHGVPAPIAFLRQRLVPLAHPAAVVAALTGERHQNVALPSNSQSAQSATVGQTHVTYRQTLTIRGSGPAHGRYGSRRRQVAAIANFWEAAGIVSVRR